MFGLSSLATKVLGGLLAVILVLGLVAERSRWMSRAHGDEATMAAWCAETRTAANNPKLDCKRTGEQIIALGESVAAAKAAIASQNAKVAALGAETVRQQNIAAEAQKQAATRADAAKATSQRLVSSAAHSGPAHACEASDALKGAWK